LDASQAARVARRLVLDGPLGAGRATMLGWLVEAGNRQRQDVNAAQVGRDEGRACLVRGLRSNRTAFGQGLCA
jgi:hypothetical protein